MTDGPISDYGSGNQGLISDLSPVLQSLIGDVSIGTFSAADAASIVQLLQSDFGPTQEEFTAAVVDAGTNLGLNVDDEFFVLSAFGNTHQTVDGASGNDTLTSPSGSGYLRGFDGDDTLTGSSNDDVLDGGEGNDTLNGGEGDDIYVYRTGDGNDSISDYNYRGGNDRLVLTDLNPGDVTVGRDGQNLTLTFTNGEVLTVNRYLDGNLRHNIEAIEFADGTVWDHAAARQQMVEDMKATGAVVGTDRDETYTHTSGDGSYSISDYNYRGGNDAFVFVDVASTDVTVQRLSSDANDVVFTLDNGDQITLNDQLMSNNRYGVETISFLDGVEWDRNDLAFAPIVDDNLIFV